MKFDDTYVNNQNLLKCCVYTLLQKGDDAPNWEVGDGTEVQCRTGGRIHRMVLLNGVWRWIDPRAAELEQRDKHSQKGGLLDRLRRR